MVLCSLKDTVLGGGNVTVIAYKSHEAPQTVNSIIWTEVASQQWTQDRDVTDHYMLWGYCEYTIANKDAKAEIRIKVDGAEAAYDHFKPENAGDYRSFSPMGLKSVGLGIHSIVLEVKGSTLDNITVRRRRLLVIKH